MLKKARVFPRWSLMIILFLIVIKCADAEILKIGVSFSESDKFNSSTKKLVSGINIAKDLFEKTHNGIKVKLIHYGYSYHNLTSVDRAAHKICEDKVPIVIGGEYSEDALMLGKVLNSCNVVLLSPTATNPKVSESRKYVFKMSASDEFVAKKMAYFVNKEFNSSFIGVIDDVSRPYSDFLSKSFVKYYTPFNGGAIVVKKILREDIDYSNVIDDFIRKRVTVVVMFTYDIDLMKFSYQAAKKKYFPIYIGSDGWGSKESIEKLAREPIFNGGKFIAYQNNYWKDDSSSRLNIEFKTLYQSNYGNIPCVWSAIGFDSTWLALSVLSDEKNEKNIRDKIYKSRLELVTTSNASFDFDNSQIKDIYVYKITAYGTKYFATLKSSE